MRFGGKPPSNQIAAFVSAAELYLRRPAAASYGYAMKQLMISVVLSVSRDFWLRSSLFVGRDLVRDALPQNCPDGGDC